MTITSSTSRVPAKNLKGVMTYLKPEVYEALVKEAESEDRSISNLISRVVTDWVVSRQATKK